MTKYSLRRRAAAVVMGVLFLLLQFLEPVYSQTSLNALTSCNSSAASSADCAALFQAAPSAVRGAIVSPNPTNPLFGTLPSKELVLAGGGAAALWYLSNQNMQNLQNQAMQNAPLKYPVGTRLIAPNGTGGAAVMAFCSVVCSLSHTGLQGDNYDYGYKEGVFVGKGYLGQEMYIDQPAAPPSLPDAAQSLSDGAIYAEAAAAAAAAARDFANKKDVAGAQTAAAAAAAAAGVVAASPSATQADKDKANGAAAAAAAAAADAADPTKAPTTPQNPGFAFTRVNFLVYAVSAQGFGNKFPFGMFAPLPASSTQMACPVVSSWGTSVELCFIRDIIRVIKWIVWSNFAIYCFVNL